MPGIPLPELLKKVVHPSTRGQPIVSTPVLLWEVTGWTPEPVVLTEPATESDLRPQDPPAVYELKKRASNAFAMGITVGRTPNNDVVLELRSVSRFHAYFREGAAGAWTLVDAESKLGTYLNGTKLTPNTPAPVPDRARIRFGTAELLFFTPDSLLEFAARWRAQ